MTTGLKIFTTIIYLILVSATVFVSMTLTEAVLIGKMAAKVGIVTYFTGIFCFFISRIVCAKTGKIFHLGTGGMTDGVKLIYRSSWFLMGFGFVIHLMLVLSIK